MPYTYIHTYIYLTTKGRLASDVTIAPTQKIMVSVELLKAYCIPLLLYGVEATAPSKQVMQMMERYIDVAVKKIVKVSATENCKAIRFCVGLDHIDDIIKKRNCNFMNSLVAHHFDLDVMQLAFV